MSQPKFILTGDLLLKRKPQRLNHEESFQPPESELEKLLKNNDYQRIDSDSIEESLESPLRSEPTWEQWRPFSADDGLKETRPPKVDDEKLWKMVHDAANTGEVEWIEPDIEYHFPVLENEDAERTADSDDIDLPTDELLWHLDETFVRDIHAQVQTQQDTYRVKIAQIDTGYTHHPVIATMIEQGRVHTLEARDFWLNIDGAIDPMTSIPVIGFPFQPGHGTGTLGVLAGDYTHPDTENRYLGMNPYCEVLPIRASPSVIHIRTSAMANAIDYAVKKGAKVINICMGGLPSQRWAESVNHAYEQGVIICAAAGNHFRLPAGFTTPEEVVYPARFGRTIAVGAMSMSDTPNGKQYHPYITHEHNKMGGNHGPQVDISGYTPGILWAVPQGDTANPVYTYQQAGGTSSATPQVSAAAALWYGQHRDILDALPNEERYKIVEAFRYAAQTTARKHGQEETPYLESDTASGSRNDYFGDGAIDIARIMEADLVLDGLHRRTEDSIESAVSEFLNITSPNISQFLDGLRDLWNAWLGNDE